MDEYPKILELLDGILLGEEMLAVAAEVYEFGEHLVDLEGSAVGDERRLVIGKSAEDFEVIQLENIAAKVAERGVRLEKIAEEKPRKLANLLATYLNRGIFAGDTGTYEGAKLRFELYHDADDNPVEQRREVVFNTTTCSIDISEPYETA